MPSDIIPSTKNDDTWRDAEAVLGERIHQVFIMNSPAQRVIAVDHFLESCLEYLKNANIDYSVQAFSNLAELFALLYKSNDEVSLDRIWQWLENYGQGDLTDSAIFAFSFTF